MSDSNIDTELDNADYNLVEPQNIEVDDVENVESDDVNSSQDGDFENEGQEDTENTEQTGESEDEDEGQQPEFNHNKPKKPLSRKQQRYNDRMKKKTEELYQSREKIARLEGQLKAFEQFGVVNNPNVNAGANNQSAQEELPPNPDNYDTNADYINALVSYNTSLEIKKVKEGMKKEQEKAVKSQIKDEKVKRFADNVNQAQNKYQDWESVVNNSDFYASESLVQEIQESDVAGDLMYFLGRNPNIGDKLNGLSGRALTREVAKIEVRLSTPTPKKKTGAPPPIKTVGSNNTSGAINMNKLSTDDFMRLRNEGKI